MFASTETEDALIQAAAAESKEVVDASMRAWQAHVKTTLSDGAYYAVPFDVSESATKYMVVQFVSAAPGAKKYMEKLTRWGTDAWQGQVAVANLGSLTAPAPSDRGADAESALVPLPGTTRYQSFLQGLCRPWQWQTSSSTASTIFTSSRM